MADGNTRCEPARRSHHFGRVQRTARWPVLEHRCPPSSAVPGAVWTARRLLRVPEHDQHFCRRARIAQAEEKGVCVPPRQLGAWCSAVSVHRWRADVDEGIRREV